MLSIHHPQGLHAAATSMPQELPRGTWGDEDRKKQPTHHCPLCQAAPPFPEEGASPRGHKVARQKGGRRPALPAGSLLSSAQGLPKPKGQWGQLEEARGPWSVGRSSSLMGFAGPALARGSLPRNVAQLDPLQESPPAEHTHALARSFCNEPLAGNSPQSSCFDEKLHRDPDPPREPSCHKVRLPSN